MSGTLEGGPNTPASWAANSPDAEAYLLRAFWKAVSGFKKGTVWITFNGKRFDVPFMEPRSTLHGLRPTRRDLLNTYPYKHQPHADLAWLWPQHYSLSGLCGLLDVPSPKSDVDGSQVAGLVPDGQMAAISTYAKRDAMATWMCSQRVLPCMGLSS